MQQKQHTQQTPHPTALDQDKETACFLIDIIERTIDLT